MLVDASPYRKARIAVPIEFDRSDIRGHLELGRLATDGDAEVLCLGLYPDRPEIVRSLDEYACLSLSKLAPQVLSHSCDEGLAQGTEFGRTLADRVHVTGCDGRRGEAAGGTSGLLSHRLLQCTLWRAHAGPVCQPFGSRALTSSGRLSSARMTRWLHAREQPTYRSVSASCTLAGRNSARMITGASSPLNW